MNPDAAAYAGLFVLAGLLVLAVLAILMPLFVYQAQRWAHQSAKELREIRRLLVTEIGRRG